MGLTAEQINAGLDAVAAREPAIARALELAGYPAAAHPRRAATSTLMRTIVGQQVSVAAATSVWNKLEATLGEVDAAEAVLARRFRHAARVRPVAPEAGLCALAVASWCRAASSTSTTCPRTTRKRSSS